MQQGEIQYGDGLYPPSIPHDQASPYGQNPTYGSAPPLTPSAPAYSPVLAYSHAAPNNPSVPSYNSFPDSPSFAAGQANYPGYGYGSPSVGFTHPDNSLGLSSNSNPSAHPYAPVMPSYQGVSSPPERSYEFGLQSAPTPTPYYAPAPQHPSQSSSMTYRAATGPAPAAYNDIYDQGKGEQGYGGAIYDPGRRYEESGYERSDVEDYRNAGGAGRNYENGGFLDFYAYDGGDAEPYGARRGSSLTVGGSGFNPSGESLDAKIKRATPLLDGDTDSGGVEKFRVKLLPETRSTDSIKDVLCQIGLDGVRMLDPSTSRTLRIYPLDTITKWEVKEPSVFTFWAKSAVDVDQRVIQLKSSNYTTTAILDTLTAACVQLCEMGVKDSPPPGGSSSVETPAKKGSVLDWVALRPRAPTNEEKQHWVPDEAVKKCTSCDSDFGAFLRRHHCRNCGDIFCDKCTQGRIALNADDDSQPVRVCDRCLAEVTHRLQNRTKAISKAPSTHRTHEDLAKKLQEELERNHAGRKQVSGRSSGEQTSVLNCEKCGSITLVTGNKSGCSNCGANRGSRNESETRGFSESAGSQAASRLWSSSTPVSNGTNQRMREVACPTCTVHLQVQVPAFGTETVECGVCQHPFLVSA